MTLEDLIQQSNFHIHSFEILIDTPFLKQCSDTEFKETNYIAKKEDVYDGIIVMKRDNKYYLDVGYDGNLFCDLFIQIQFNLLNIKLVETFISE
jgi:hypothetical protein